MRERKHFAHDGTCEMCGNRLPRSRRGRRNLLEGWTGRKGCGNWGIWVHAARCWKNLLRKL